MGNEQVIFNKGKKKREELQLPILTFVCADDWMDKLGYDAFCAWLKFYSWCDRSESRNNKDDDVIPYSFTKIMKRLGVGKKKFYNSIIRPLWNYGLIDIEQFEKSISYGQKPMNIIVYEYPQNDVTKKYKSLEKIRDYDTEYTSTARTFAKKGGRKQNKRMEGFTGKQGGFPHETGGGFTEKPNNDSNSINNNSNSINNDSNNNLSIYEREIINTGLPLSIQKILINKIDRLIADNISLHTVINNYLANKEEVNEYQYAEILHTVLTHTRNKIENISNVMHVAIKRYINTYSHNDHKESNKQTEIIPDWFKERKKQEGTKKDKHQSPKINDSQKQRELEELEQMITQQTSDLSKISQQTFHEGDTLESELHE